MAVSQQQIKELLGTGLSNEVVATAVGCDPSYISQLLSDEDFSTEVANLRMKNLISANSRDRKLDDLEDKLLDKLIDTVDFIHKPGDQLRALAVVNAAKRRGTSSVEQTVVQNTIVNLQIPTQIVQKFVTNAQGEVIEVAGQTMVTMNSGSLLRELAAEKSDDGEKYRQVLSRLPGS